MKIKINNQTQIISSGTTLKTIAFSQLGEKQKGIAIAVNETVIPKLNWEKHIIQSNDNILIIKATQGG